MEGLNGTEVVSCYKGNLSVNGELIHGLDFWDNCYRPCYSQWYPPYQVYEKSEIERAFKIAGKLLEEKIIEKELTIREFIKLVNDIAEII